MKNYYKKIIFLTFLNIGILACSDEEEQNNEPQIHADIDIDVDNNGVNDFKIEYYKSRIHFAYINAQITPYWSLDTKILINENYSNVLELNEITEVINPVDPSSWENRSGSLMSIGEYGQFGQWETSWSINASNQNQESYLVHVKLAYNDGSEQLGWIRLYMDKNTGLILVLDKGLI